MERVLKIQIGILMFEVFCILLKMRMLCAVAREG
jgi:hypothetical protein